MSAAKLLFVYLTNQFLLGQGCCKIAKKAFKPAHFSHALTSVLQACLISKRIASLVETATASTPHIKHQTKLLYVLRWKLLDSGYRCFMKFSSRVALVTGSTSGIGAAIARRLSNEGFAVVLHSRNSVEEGHALASELPMAAYIQADLGNEMDRERLICEAIAVWGRLDVLVNNAGISRVIPHADISAATPDVWQALHEINVVAPFRLVAHAESALRDAAATGKPACIINVSSHAGIRPKGASIPYAATKAALNHVTRLLAVSLAPLIRVNAVAPGLVDTPMTADWTQAQQLWKERAPMRRAASPEDIAQAVAMLVASDYLTGEILLSDGGLNLT